MTDLYARWLDLYPIVSLEDGLGDDDWVGFQAHTAALGGRVQIVGDDIFVTNTQFIGRGIQEHSANAALIKLNQIGTVTETVEAIEMCRNVGWNTVISHRSGETEDPFIADFTVAMGAGRSRPAHCAAANASRNITACWRLNGNSGRGLCLPARSNDSLQAAPRLHRALRR